jgi:hypothetical protein
MAICGAVQPGRPEVTCNRSGPPSGHPVHSGPSYGQSGRPMYVDWENPDFVPPPPRPGSHDGLLASLVAEVDAESRLARSEPQGGAQEAALVYSRTKRKTRLGKVAEYLIAHQGEWIDAAHFADAEVGGFAGTRRLRELREEYAWPISTRRSPDPNKPNHWEHRLDYVPRLDMS